MISGQIPLNNLDENVKKAGLTWGLMTLIETEPLFAMCFSYDNFRISKWQVASKICRRWPKDQLEWSLGLLQNATNTFNKVLGYDPNYRYSLICYVIPKKIGCFRRRSQNPTWMQPLLRNATKIFIKVLGYDPSYSLIYDVIPQKIGWFRSTSQSLYFKMF